MASIGYECLLAAKYFSINNLREFSERAICPSGPAGFASPLLTAPMVPLRPHLLDATMSFVTAGPYQGQNRETSPRFPVSKYCERTSGAVLAARRPRSKLQVVPGSIVLKVDRLAGWSEQRVS